MGYCRSLRLPPRMFTDLPLYMDPFGIERYTPILVPRKILISKSADDKEAQNNNKFKKELTEVCKHIRY